MLRDWSPRVHELGKVFKPYWRYEKGIAEDASQEAKGAFEECRKLIRERSLAVIERERNEKKAETETETGEANGRDAETNAVRGTR